jgi:hypothetical protein
VNDERVEVVGEAFGGPRSAGDVELIGQGPEPLLAVALAGGVNERLPVGQTDAFALPLGQLGEQRARREVSASLAETSLVSPAAVGGS